MHWLLLAIVDLIIDALFRAFSIFRLYALEAVSTKVSDTASSHNRMFMQETLWFKAPIHHTCPVL